MPIRRLLPLILIIMLVVLLSSCGWGNVPVSPSTPSAAAPLTVTPTAPTLPTPGTVPASITAIPAAWGHLQRVVYAKANGIWLWDVTAAPKQLTHSEQDASPKISDDGLVIAFLRGSELWAVNADGTQERRLSPIFPQFDFAPRSHTVYLADEKYLARVNADAPALEMVLDRDWGGRFVFSSNGAKIAVLRSDSISVVDADGNVQKTVFTFAPMADTVPEVVWLPDGSGFKTVVYVDGRAHLMFISADGAIVAKLAEFDASPSEANRPFISPDGAQVLYTKTHSTDLELHTIDASTADKTYFSYPADTFGAVGWTPDSKHFVYRLGDKLLLGPGQPVALTDAPNMDSMVWVDGQRFLFVQNAELRFHVLGYASVVLDTGLLDGSTFDFVTAK